ncbi:MAG: carboxypeptidase regulatory-like domain-containing protein [bacterium]|nr:MAG: carboxypeptidase regulatory-like domain-containing protein [bacterium]
MIRTTKGETSVRTVLILLMTLTLWTDAGWAASGKTAKKSGISGTVVMRETGEPVKKAYVYAYVGKPQVRARTLGIIGITDWVSHGTAEDGTYTMDLPPGEYYVVARKRKSGLNYGPLYQGDFYDHSHAGEAVVVRRGRYVECNFKLKMLMEPLFFQGLSAKERETDTGVRGRLLDGDGNHVPGTFVIAYKDEDMYRLPDFASTLTDDEGNYILYLPKGGRYWLAARFYAMKVPEEGEPFARYEGSDDHSVMVPDGTFLEGIDMTLRPYDGSPPEGYRPVH